MRHVGPEVYPVCAGAGAVTEQSQDSLCHLSHCIYPKEALSFYQHPFINQLIAPVIGTSGLYYVSSMPVSVSRRLQCLLKIKVDCLRHCCRVFFRMPLLSPYSKAWFKSLIPSLACPCNTQGEMARATELLLKGQFRGVMCVTCFRKGQFPNSLVGQLYICLSFYMLIYVTWQFQQKRE